MTETGTERRMAENEVIFRGYNQRIQKGFTEVRKLGKETNQEHLIPHDDTELHFYCECADENCKQRIQMEPSLYEKIHTNPKRFIVIHGHQVTRVEQVVVTKPNYMVVEKYVLPPPTAGTLNATGVKNT